MKETKLLLRNGYHKTFKGLFCFLCDIPRTQFGKYNNMGVFILYESDVTNVPLFEDETIDVDFHLHVLHVAKDQCVTLTIVTSTCYALCFPVPICTDK